MNYQQTLDWMFQRLPNYQIKGTKAYSNKLAPIIEFCNYLNQPQEQFKSIHVAGTNGKGSSSHMLASVLQEAGYRVGLYTSPHLKDFRERIKISGQLISQTEVVEFIKLHQPYIEGHQLSFFELTVAMAFDHFAKQAVDIAIIEVGLGGRLDSTNIITPEVSLITNIGFDHKEVLGSTLAQIAGEKAGIIKKNTPVVISEYQEDTWEVFQKRAKELKAPLYLAEKTTYKSDLIGSYQQKNINGVVEVIKRLEGFKIPENAVVVGLKKVVEHTGLLGRWQLLQEAPSIILDTAHNAEGLAYTMKQLQETPKHHLRIVFGMVQDKELDKVVELLPKEAIYYLCAPMNHRAMPVERLEDIFNQKGLVNSSHTSVQQALDRAKNEASKEDVIYVGGSTFVVAEVV